MLFYVIRVIICAPIYFLINGLIGHRRANSCRNRLVSVALSTIICIGSFFLPVENVFHTFSSCESAYSYNHTSPIETIVYGTDSDMVIGIRDMAILPKVDAGWKLCVGPSIVNVASIIHEDTITLFYRHRNSVDYYLFVYNSYGKPMDVSDNRQSVFQAVAEYQPRLDDSNYTYYTCIQNLDEEYALTVDGQRISFDEAVIRVTN